MHKRLLFIFLIFAIGAAHAEQRPLYSTASYVARGKAMVADVDDNNALFVNPAGMQLIKEPIWLLAMQLEGSSGMTDNFTALFGHTEDRRWKITDPQELAALNGTNNRGRGTFLATYLTDQTSYSVIAAGTLDTAYDTAAIPNTTVFSALDIAFQFGMADSFLESKKLRLGSNIRLVYRGNRKGILDFTQLQQQGIKPVDSPYANEGMAISVDLGSQYTWQKQGYDLSLGLAMLDISTPFMFNTLGLFKATNGGRPESLPMRLDVGVGLKVPNLFYGVALRTNLDIIKSMTKMESSIADMLHLGMELKLPQFLTLRAGLNQLYWTAGLGIKYWVAEIDFATYAENTMIYDSQRLQSFRRYMFEFNFYL